MRIKLAEALDDGLAGRLHRLGELVGQAAAQVAGGGGGGRDTMAQAGGRDPEKLPEALEAAREAIVHSLR